jgi:hypothetical protein
MRLVIECLRCEQACRALAAKLASPNDKRALELMASGWARRAAERLRKLEAEAVPLAAPRLPPTALRNTSVDTARRPARTVH